LTDEQKRLFETYIKQNYAKELENPLFVPRNYGTTPQPLPMVMRRLGRIRVCSMTVNLPTYLA
jgi:hypothetical protein